MKSKLYIGSKREVELPDTGFLLITDEVGKLPKPKPYQPVQKFDPKRHSFNVVEDMDYWRASDFVGSMDALFSRGESTLTKDTGLDFIFDALEEKPGSLESLIEKPGRGATTGHVWAYSKVRRLLRSPVLKKVLGGSTNFTFKENSKTFARVNRSELRSFDARALTYFLMAQFKGTIVIPNYAPYALESHIDLIEQDRLIVGVNTLDELPEKLRQRMMLLEEKIPQGTTFEDAETLAKYAGRIPSTNKWHDFVDAAMRGGAGGNVTER